jgi:TPR repeat protein
MVMHNEAVFLKGDELFESGNYEQAFSCFLSAASEGCVHSMLRLASMYTCGEGVGCNYDKAIDWELKAAELGELAAFLNLGISYRIKGDILKAKHWFEKSLEAGDGSGALQLAKLYMVSLKENVTVVGYLKFAINAENMCESDIEEAEELLAQMKAS